MGQSPLSVRRDGDNYQFTEYGRKSSNKIHQVHHMKKTIFDSEAIVQISDGGEKSMYVRGTIKSVYTMAQGTGNDSFLIIEEMKNKVDVFVNLNYIISVTIIKAKKMKEKETKVEFEDKSIC